MSTSSTDHVHGSEYDALDLISMRNSFDTYRIEISLDLVHEVGSRGFSSRFSFYISSHKRHSEMSISILDRFGVH